VLGGIGGAITGFSNGEGWRGALARGGLGAATAWMPLGAGAAADIAGNALIGGAMKGNIASRARPSAMPKAIGQV
jgi:hypothetical protein